MIRKSNATRLFASCLALTAIALSSPLRAGGFAEAEAGPNWSINVGGFAFVSPTYEGADSYKVMAVPVAFPSGLDGVTGGRVQFRGPDDIRFRLFGSTGFVAGPLAGWRFDREEDDAQRLRGLGDVDGGLVVGGYAGYVWHNVMPFVSYHRQVTGDDTGGVVRFGIEGWTQRTSGLTMRATVGASYADADYMRSYFSITPQQSLTSVAGLPVFDADDGLKDVYVALSADVPLWTDWTLKLSGRYARLLGDAADSPVVASEDQFSAGIGLTYRFGVSR